MRARRYFVLAAVVVAALAALGAAARRNVRGLARERAEGLRNTLAGQLARFEEHARYLARLAPADLPAYLLHFQGLARVQLFDAAGKPELRVERFDYAVAAVQGGSGGAPAAPADGSVAVTGFRVDDAREDVHPAYRNVVDYVVRRPGGGTLQLTVYAEPFLAALRAAGANLLDGDGRGLLGPADAEAARAAGPGWTVALPVEGTGWTGSFLASAAAVLGLAAAAVLLSERQLRSQERAALQARLALDERLRALGILAAGIAHEINNPLEGIANWLSLGDTEKAKEGFERIRSIVKDLLSFARPEGGDAARADVGACAERACELARFAAVSRGVAFTCEVPDGTAAALAPRALEQVLLNLLLNAAAAVRASPERRVDLAASSNGRSVSIAVCDTGPGIAPADLPRLFDPFFSRSGGTGLGLSVSYGIAQAVGGSLTAANRPEGGARFVLEVPRP